MGDRRQPFEPSEIDGLLATGGGALSGLAEGLEEPPPADVQRWLGARFGPYELVEYLDRGGMSLVYRAERRAGDFEQSVAVKLLNAPGSEQMAARFSRERQILAGLEHPNIARIIDGGVAEGQPFMVMELVAGTAIDRYCDERRLDLNERIDLFVQVCRAVQFAHTRLVVHRDIKPGNILVTPQGEVRLLDFGIAKLLVADGTDLTTGTPLLTPRFASPEQVLGQPVNVASDVYQLGLLLHLLLTGLHAQTFRQASIAEIKKAVVDSESLSPSKALETTGRTDRDRGARIAEARRTQFERLKRRMRGDLDLIVASCLAKEPARRFASVQQLIDDLRAYREHRPIQARAPSRAYRMGRFARRHWGGVTTGLLTAAALLIAFGAVFLSWRETLQAQAIAKREARTAEAVSSFLAGMLERADPRRDSSGEPLAVVDLLDQGAANVDQLADQPGVQVQLLKTMAGAYFGLGKYDAVEGVARRALALQDANPEFDPKVRIQILQSLGSALVGLGRLDEAMTTAEEAVALGEALGPELKVEQARALHTMAVALFDQGELKRALALDNQALSLLGDGPDSLRPRMVVLNTIGSAARRLGDHATALEYFQRALELLSSDEALAFQRGYVLRGMAQTRYAQGQPLKARELAAEAVASDRRVFGEESDKIFRSMIVLALYDLRLLDLPAAAAHFAEVGRIAGLLGQTHPNYPVARFYTAQYQHQVGLLKEATASIGAAIASRGQIYGEQDRAILEYRLMQALFDLRQGRAGEAESGLAGIRDALAQAYVAGHPVRDGFRYIGARVAAERGQHQEAVTLLAELVAEHQGAATRPAEFGDYLLALGSSRAALGDGRGAEDDLRAALEYQQALWGADAPGSLQARVRLAALLAGGKPGEALTLAHDASRLGRAQTDSGNFWAALLLAENAATLRRLNEVSLAAGDCDLARSVLARNSTADLPVATRAQDACGG